MIFLSLADQDRTLFVTSRTLFVKALDVHLFHLYYIVILNGNDFCEKVKFHTESGKQPLSLQELIKEIKRKCTTEEDCARHFKQHTNRELKDEFEKVKNLYNFNQVDYPYNNLTTDLADVEAIQSKIPESFVIFGTSFVLDVLLEIGKAFSRCYQNTGFNLIYSASYGVPLVQPLEYEECCRSEKSDWL